MANQLKFTISFNGTMPSSSLDIPAAAYTGPSVESVSGSKPAISSATLGVAIGVPLLVIAVAVALYVVWQKKKRAPEKKRWSAVIDNRLSMISAGTAPPPRFSMYSQHSAQQSRPSMSQSVRSHTTASMYSAVQTPLPGGASPRLSFVEAPRPSFERKQSGLRNSESAHSRPNAARHSVAGILTESKHATNDENAPRSHGHSWSTSALPRSRSTQEQLASPRQRTTPSKLRNATNRISTASVGGTLESMTAVKFIRDPSLAYDLSKSASSGSSSSLDDEIKADEEEGPFADSLVDQTAPAQRHDQAHHMPKSSMSSITPDDALQRYAATTAAPSLQSPALITSDATPATKKGALFRGMIRSFSRTLSPTRSASSSSFATAPAASSQHHGDGASEHVLSTPPLSPVNKELPSVPVALSKSSSTLALLAMEEERELQRQKKALSAMSFAASPPSLRPRRTHTDSIDSLARDRRSAAKYDHDVYAFEEKDEDDFDEKAFGTAL